MQAIACSFCSFQRIRGFICWQNKFLGWAPRYRSSSHSAYGNSHLMQLFLFLLPWMFTCLNWGADASQKLLMGRKFCLPYCAYLLQKLQHTFKQKAETHTETTVSKENSIKTKSGGLVGKSLSAMAEWGNSNLLTNTAWTPISPGKPAIPYFMPSSKFYPIPFVFPPIPAAGSCLPSLWGALLSVTHLCFCGCTCTLWPQGSWIPPVGHQELAQVFLSGFAWLGQSCVNSVCSRI